MSDWMQKIERSAKLVSLPDIYFRLKALMDDPGYTLAEVALLVGHDPGMATRFLRIVNSPLYRRAAKIETVSHAVSMLGARQVHDIVLGASIARAFDGIATQVMDMHRFWKHSVYCAATARQLATCCDKAEKERMFLCGLLSDMGHLFMYHAIPEDCQKAILRAGEQQRPLYRVEREMFGFDHAHVSGRILGGWDLPKSLVIPVSSFPEPDSVDSFQPETDVLHIAALLVDADEGGVEFGTDPFVADPASCSRTGVTAEMCMEARQEAEKHYQALADSLFL
jgi:HD-like signal output (HDOD) protein